MQYAESSKANASESDRELRLLSRYGLLNEEGRMSVRRQGFYSKKHFILDPSYDYSKIFPRTEFSTFLAVGIHVTYILHRPRSIQKLGRHAQGALLPGIHFKKAATSGFI